jgi:LPPG:FO 2-phospho-L-lactate transferase
MVRLLPPRGLTLVVNTADDEEFYGLHVSPDLDTVIYNLAGAAPLERGWGLAGDSHRVLSALRRFYRGCWFQLGDLDLATHLFRTDALRAGRPLHRVTAEIASAFGVEAIVLPMSDQRVRTFVETRRGERLSFQEYFAHRRARDPVRRLHYRGARLARPAPGVLAAIRRADLLVLPPSNPFTSIRPILAVPGIRTELRRRRAPLVAVSPVAGGRAVRGPLAGMLRAAGTPVSPIGIARLYRGLLDGMVIDCRDVRLQPQLERRGIAVAVVDVEMGTMERSIRVARAALTLARKLRGA